MADSCALSHDPKLHNTIGSCLVVEDNLFAAEIMSMFLGKYGISVDMAANGKEALDKYLSVPVPYDIIFMDLQMPVMNGYEATERIRNSGYNGAGAIPIVAMTGETLGDLDKCGFTDCLKKPFNIKQDLPFIIKKLFPLQELKL